MEQRGESNPAAEHRTCDLVFGALDEGLLLPEELVEDAAAGAEGLPLRDRVVVPHRAHRRRRRAPPSRGRGAGGDVRRRRWHQRPECDGRHHLRPLFAVNSVGFEYQNCEWIGSGELHNAARQASVRVERIRIGGEHMIEPFPLFFQTAPSCVQNYYFRKQEEEYTSVPASSCPWGLLECCESPDQ